MTRQEYIVLARKNFLKAATASTGILKSVRGRRESEGEISCEPKSDFEAILIAQAALTSYNAMQFFLRDAGVVTEVNKEVEIKVKRHMTNKEYAKLVAASFASATEAVAGKINSALQDALEELVVDDDGDLPKDMMTTMSASVSARVALISFDAMLNFLQDAGVIVITDETS